MAREKEKKISKLTKGYAWLSIVFYCLACFVVGFMLFGIMLIMFYNLLYSKLSGEYSTIEYLARMYEAARQSDNESVMEVLDTDDRPFFVKDVHGRVIYKKGKISCSDEMVNIGIPLLGRSVKVYEDTEFDLFKQGPMGLVSFDLKEFEEDDGESETQEAYPQGPEDISGLEELDEFLKEQGLTGGDNEKDSLKNVQISISSPGFGSIRLDEMIDNIPVWIPVKINGGQYVLVAKVFIGMDVDDIELMVAIIEAFILINLLIFVILIFSVIRSIKRQKEITNLLFKDDDTGGHNWMWFTVNAEKTLLKRRNAGRRYALVNLFFVKYRNYCMIHTLEAGKRALWRVYHTLGGFLGKKAIAAHVSSSSFALLMEYDNEEQLKSRLNTLIGELEKTGGGHKFSFQAGVALIDVVLKRGRIRRRKSINLDKEYNYACTARDTMALSEDSGIMIYDDKLMEEQKWVDAVTEHQQKALNNEEFVVYYQPKYSPDTNELRGAEALIRWQSPEYGFVSPGRIIPIFERNGFITEIDHYMITHVARDQKAWMDAGYKCVPVSVNVSRAHFIESDLAEQIRDMVDGAGAPRDMIEIELTESAFFDDKNALINTINRLKSYGFSVSMDDFGAGYSSLNSLKDMSLDVLKLDAEFFRGDSDSQRKEIVVSEAIRLAKSLNMRTVAEGVEEKEQVEFLAKQGCDMIQGYYFAKPMPKTDYEMRMRSGVENKEDQRGNET